MKALGIMGMILCTMYVFREYRIQKILFIQFNDTFWNSVVGYSMNNIHMYSIQNSNSFKQYNKVRKLSRPRKNLKLMDVKYLLWKSSTRLVIFICPYLSSILMTVLLIKTYVTLQYQKVCKVGYVQIHTKVQNTFLLVYYYTGLCIFTKESTKLM